MGRDRRTLGRWRITLQMKAFGTWTDKKDYIFRYFCINLHLPLYFECQENGQCIPKPALKLFLKENKVSLLSSCKTNRCLTLHDDALIEVLPGLYYFLGNG